LFVLISDFLQNSEKESQKRQYLPNTVGRGFADPLLFNSISRFISISDINALDATMSFYNVLNKYRASSYSEVDKGTKFEELIARYLVTDPLYETKIDEVWLWKNFPGNKQIGIHDTGIDIVVKTKYDEYWAIQCKCYNEEYEVTKKDVDTFITTSGRKFKDEIGDERFFDERILFATTNNWSSNAVAATEGQHIPVTRIKLSNLEEAAVDWDAIEEGVHGKEARKKKYELRGHQQEALDKALEHYKTHDKGQMIMACGTGKTFASLRIAETMTKGKGNILFLAPSIALIGQTLREWTANAQDELNMNTICVCSDPKVSKKFSEDDIGEHVEDLGAPATTDPEKIMKQIKTGGGLTVIFSTYQSIDSIIEAQQKGLPEFDLIICDEAHRTTGAIFKDQSEKAFTKVHSNENIKAKKRLYMTATPRIYGVKGKEDAKKESVTLCSMDDENTYGKEFYKIGFGKAVELGLLSDYKVLVLTVKESNVPEMMWKRWEKHYEADKEIDVDLECKIWGTMNALAKNIAYDETIKHSDPGKMRSAVSFSRTIAASKEITKIFNVMPSIPGGPLEVEVKHIDGEMNSMQRDKLLGWLKKDDDKCRMLSNVRCLSEGVDVPALDAVIFMGSKGSLIDIVQSVGRVMRKSPDKTYGYIIVPVVVPRNESPEEALEDDERYRMVWQVLRALRSHDERLEAEINTFAFRKKEPGKSSGGHIVPAVTVGEEEGTDRPLGGQYTLDDFGTALMARLVIKVGEREYIENWARDVAKIMPELMEKLNLICMHDGHGYKQYGPAFKRYFKGLKDCINDDVNEEDAVKMLAQQIITKPIFTALFGDDKFVRQNSVSQTIDAMLNEIDAKNGLKDIDLSKFYEGVERTLTKIETLEGKQKVITSLYEKFFKNAFPKDQTINGIVYTPEAIVDFIIHSAAETLKQEFNIEFGSENVNILDPFTGTGTFIARLIESSIISPHDLERKYRYELFANEITLLAYYIAAVNIENAFSRKTKTEEYIPFEHILLTDTFNIEEICHGRQTTLVNEEYFKKNIGRIKEENDTQITVIIGNPPYGGKQRNANDDAKKRTYLGGVDGEIEKKYLDNSLFEEKKGNVNSVYDNYIRAFRWSTDRINDSDGVIAFVTPNGWLSGSAFIGFRKCIEKEFSKIYIFNLRGDQNGQNWREEGEKIFGQGSKIGISITLLVKRKNFKGKAKILYVNTKDYMKRQEKFDLLGQSESFSQMEKSGSLKILNAKGNGDWITQRNSRFQAMIPLAGDTHKKFDSHYEKTVFVGYSRGCATSRDLLAYNFSKERLAIIKSDMVKSYSEQLEAGLINYNDSRVKWTTPLKKNFENNRRLSLDTSTFTLASYRPFVKNWFDHDVMINESSYQMPRIYPTHDAKNLQICVAGIGVKKDFSCIITDEITDLNFTTAGQCFPLYWYEDSSEKRSKMKVESIDGTTISTKKNDGISDFALKLAKDMYGNKVTKEDIFFYVYGFLHSPDYRNTFTDDLKMSLPKIEFVSNPEDFWTFSKAGRELAEIHLNYEKVKAPETIKFSGAIKIEDVLKEPNLCHITKMKVLPKERKVIFNQFLTIENIPEEAFEYIVNGKSAIEWIEDQYQYSKDNDSGIINDPNEYSGGKYILNLLLSVIGVSVKTVEIVKALPKLILED